MKSCNSLVLRSREYPIVFIPPTTLNNRQHTMLCKISFLTLTQNQLCVLHDFITITNMVHVSMERELNKLFNNTNYDKENMIIREI